MSNRKLRGWLLAVFLVLISLGVSRAKAQLVTVDYPGATETDCNDINKRGAVVGFYTGGGGAMHDSCSPMARSVPSIILMPPRP